MLEGYVILATGCRNYVDMAINLAASIKVMDPKRGICLVYEDGLDLPDEDRLFFSHAVAIPRDVKYPHVMNKLRVFDASPFDRTMFVDADCLLVKGDIDAYWTRAATRHFSITGSKLREGKWKGVEIKPLLKKYGINYLISMNAGVFYFDNSDHSRNFFSGLRNFFMSECKSLNITNYRGKHNHSFELYLGLFMGIQNMDSENMHGPANNSWMVSTWRALGCDFRPASGVSSIIKLDGFLFGMPFMPTRATVLSPSFAHFIGLRPRRLYNRLSAYFRGEAKRCLTCNDARSLRH